MCLVMVVRVLRGLSGIGDELLECLFLTDVLDQLWRGGAAHVHTSFFLQQKVFDRATLLLTENLVNLTSRDIAHIVSTAN